MRAETVKRMILLSVEKPPEDMEELLELYARLWSQENGGDWRPLRAAEKGTESVPEGTESVPEGTERVIEPTENVIEPEESAPEPAEAVSGEPPRERRSHPRTGTPSWASPTSAASTAGRRRPSAPRAGTASIPAIAAGR